MLTALSKFFSAIGQMFLGWGTRFALWLKKPGNPLKLVCALMALGMATMGMVAYEKESTIRQLNETLDLARERYDIDIRERDERLLLIAEILKAERESLEFMRFQNAEVLREFIEDSGKLPISLEDWRLRYQEKSDICLAAIEYLDVACPELKDY